MKYAKCKSTRRTKRRKKRSSVIGIGTDGKTVNMDLWNIRLNNGTYTLNDIDDIKAEDANTENKGYLGKIIKRQNRRNSAYIYKRKNDKNFIPVTNLKDTFSIYKMILMNLLQHL